MAWPPIAPPNNRLNTTPTVDNHPSDHNLIADSISDIINIIGQDPAGDWTDIQDRLDHLEYTLRPPGEFMYYAGTVKPEGRWLPCNNGEYPRAAPYDKLFANIGLAWGAGNGTTTFNVPGLAGYVLVGAGGAGWAATVGVKYGNKDQVVADHNHHIGSHNHGVNIYTSYYDSNHLHTGTTRGAGAHNHGVPDASLMRRYNPNGTEGSTTSPTGQRVDNIQHSDVGDHTHTFTTDAADRTMDHRHAVNGLTDHQGETGNIGSVVGREGQGGTDLNYQPSANATIWIRY